ncbi:MAG: CpXC domain-containing protein [Candidatus Thorarchaeota archaeon]
MVGTKEIEVTCEKCGKLFEAEAIDHIDLHDDRSLIKNLKSGKANRVQCPKCKKVMYLKRSIVINFDPESKIVVYDVSAKSKAAKEELQKTYENIVTFNETLEETGNETEFLVLHDLAKLKRLLEQYLKVYG